MSRWREEICVKCGKGFRTQNPSRYCSMDCWGKACSEQRRAVRPVYYCRTCGQAFFRVKRPDDTLTYCSRECYFKAKTAKRVEREQRRKGEYQGRAYCRVYITACDICGKLFTSRRPSKRCSDECNREHGRREYHRNADEICRRMRERYEPKPKTEKTCKQCGDVFIGYGTDAHCSDVCRRRAKHERKDKKRAEKMGVYYEPVNPLRVFERDGWRCQICKKKLNPKHRGTIRADAPELDHIIPWAQGGEHSYRNTQCACRKCNEEKGTIERGQLRMFG